MASSKISELVDGGSFLPGDDTIIVRNGANFKVDPTINAVNAWVNFNGTGTVAIRASYNVSSITDNGTGQYTVNFTTAMSDTNYATYISVGFSTSGGDDWVFMHERMDSKATSSTRIHIADNTTSSNADMFGVFVAVVR